MIDVHRETIRTLRQAAELAPPLRGKPIHYSTFWRWAHHGFEGVKLETIPYGGTECTSDEAIQRFCEARARLAAMHVAEQSVNEQAVNRRQSSQPDRSREAVRSQLEQLGIRVNPSAS